MAVVSLEPLAPAPARARRVAVVGAGVSGLGAALRLQQTAGFQATLFEKAATLGGHAHTVDVTLPAADGRPVTHGVDTGFLVYNERTYPRLIELFGQLGTPTGASDMSFSVQAPHGLSGRGRRLEWNGSTLDSVFAQRRNLLSPRFWWMLREILRFNRLATALAQGDGGPALQQPLREFLLEYRFGTAFQQGYLLPMIGCIWSCPLEQMLDFPLATLVRFCHNHGLLQVRNRPQWFTVKGGARNYVERMLKSIPDARLNSPVRQVRRLHPGDATTGVVVSTEHGHERFDDVVMACHSDQALALLAEPSDAEAEVLGAIGYHKNRAVLHTDTSLLPKRRLAWAAWNYESAHPVSQEHGAVCLHYLLNRLQPLPFTTPVLVSLNPLTEPRAETVIAEFDYAHPVFDLGAIRAQRRLPELQGHGQVWFCGAWTRYGFHEDGLLSAMEVSDQLQARWRTAEPYAAQEAA